MKIIARGMWPGRARWLAYVHNRADHGEENVAHIDVDEKAKTWAPKYKVWCPVCEEKEINDE